MDKALRVRLEDAEQILSDVSIKCCEVLNLISVHGVTDAHREALHIAARVVSSNVLQHVIGLCLRSIARLPDVAAEEQTILPIAQRHYR